MIWFVISIILLLFSAAVTGVALSNNVKGAGIGLIPGLVGLLLLIPACLYSVDGGEVAVIRNMGGSLAGHSEDAGFHWKTPWQSVIKYDTRNNLINFYKDTDYKYDGGSAVGSRSPSTTRAALPPRSTSKSTTALIRARPNTCTRSTANSRRSRRTTSATTCVQRPANSPADSTP